jgi:hypothetical protein
MQCEPGPLQHDEETSAESVKGRYGYQTNTRVKFVLALALVDAVVRDIDVKTVRSIRFNTGTC